AIQIRRCEFVQAPRLRLRFGKHFYFASTPTLIQLIHFLFAPQIQPSQDRSNVAVYLSKLLVRQKHPTVAFRDACESDFLLTPINSKTEITLIVSRRLVDIAHWYLRNWSWKFRFHCNSLIALDCVQFAPLPSFAILVLYTNPILARRGACSTGLVGLRPPRSRPAFCRDTDSRAATGRPCRASTRPDRSPRLSDRLASRQRCAGIRALVARRNATMSGRQSASNLRRCCDVARSHLR